MGSSACDRRWRELLIDNDQATVEEERERKEEGRDTADDFREETKQIICCCVAGLEPAIRRTEIRRAGRSATVAYVFYPWNAYLGVCLLLPSCLAETHCVIGRCPYAEMILAQWFSTFLWRPKNSGRLVYFHGHSCVFRTRVRLSLSRRKRQLRAYTIFFSRLKQMIDITVLWSLYTLLIYL